MRYSMTCTCGQVTNTEAATRVEAVEKIKAMMSKDAIAMHMADYHKGEPVPPVSQVHQTIAQMTVLSA